ncbi:MAG: hypothetical protein AAGJ94_09645, partial [Pseudomonadota bacterium]
RGVAIAVSVLAAGSAFGQSFQTALPVSPAERRAMEARLSTILDFGVADTLSEFTLPSGRTMTVRPYPLVRRTGSPPCRGYRIDLSGARSSTAVDGFRCKRSSDNVWVIVQPELVLAQDGPIDLRQGDQRGDAARTADEPLYPSDDLFAVSPPPPIPRPAPRRVAPAKTAAIAQTPPFETPPEVLPDPELSNPPTATDLPTPVAVVSAPPRLIDKPALIENGPVVSLPQTTSSLTSAAEDEAGSTLTSLSQSVNTLQSVGDDGPLSSPAGGESALVRGTASLPADEPQRVVSVVDPAGSGSAARPADGEAADDEGNGLGHYRAVVEALQDLAYLEDATPTTGATLNEAIGAFARDERFALPVSDDVLIQRLDAALERSETLPDCVDEAIGDLCLEL